MGQTDLQSKGTPVDTLNPDSTWDRLGSIAHLLHQAATQVWSDADRATADSPLHDLGLGVYLAHHKYRYLRYSYLFFLAGFVLACVEQGWRLLTH